MRILEHIDELIEAFLQGDHEFSYAFNIKTKEILLDAPKSVTGEPEIDWDDDKAVEFLLVIPQITSPEAYKLMVKFAEKQDSGIAVELLDVLNGRKPFRAFKDKLGEQEIGDKWYDFENNYAKSRMMEWLEQLVTNSLDGSQ